MSESSPEPNDGDVPDNPGGISLATLVAGELREALRELPYWSSDSA